MRWWLVAVAVLGAACGGSRDAVPRGGEGPVATAGQSAGPAATPSCETPPVDREPFGCSLAWGANGNEGTRSSYLDFITTWVGYEDDGGLGSNACDGCKLAQALATQNALATYYAYFIGYQASAAGYGDCNTDHDGQNLCTHGAAWLKQNRQRVLEMYASYAQKTFAASPDRPVAWLLEGDFIQYTYDDQSSPLSMAELGALARDIVCAIKSSQPNALVAIDHSAWLADDVTARFWAAMPKEMLDFVWTTGVGNNDGYLNPDASPGSYNARTARYEHLSSITGLGILVDTSFGASQAADSWTGTPSEDLGKRIAEGVIAVNVTEPPTDYQSRVANHGDLPSTCR